MQVKRDDVVRDEFGEDWAVNWQWSMGNAAEPAWDAPSRLPTYLLGVVPDKARIVDLGGLSLDEGDPRHGMCQRLWDTQQVSSL